VGDHVVGHGLSLGDAVVVSLVDDELPELEEPVCDPLEPLVDAVLLVAVDVVQDGLADDEEDELGADEVGAEELGADELEADELEPDELEADELEPDELEPDELGADELVDEVGPDDDGDEALLDEGPCDPPGVLAALDDDRDGVEGPADEDLPAEEDDDPDPDCEEAPVEPFAPAAEPGCGGSPGIVAGVPEA
jgi:hypothetical protein